LMHSDLGMNRNASVLRNASKLILGCWRDDVGFRLAPKASIYPCHAAGAARVLCRLGYAENRRPPAHIRASARETSSRLFQQADDEGTLGSMHPQTSDESSRTTRHKSAGHPNRDRLGAVTWAALWDPRLNGGSRRPPQTLGSVGHTFCGSMVKASKGAAIVSVVHEKAIDVNNYERRLRGQYASSRTIRRSRRRANTSCRSV